MQDSLINAPSNIHQISFVLSHLLEDDATIVTISKCHLKHKSSYTILQYTS